MTQYLESRQSLVSGWLRLYSARTHRICPQHGAARIDDQDTCFHDRPHALLVLSLADQMITINSVKEWSINLTNYGCIRIVYLCGVALTRGLDSCFGNHVTKCRSVRIVVDETDAVFSRKCSPSDLNIEGVKPRKGAERNTFNLAAVDLFFSCLCPSSPVRARGYGTNIHGRRSRPALKASPSTGPEYPAFCKMEMI
uniref:Uncharacterized protein n=1 Tax=Timema poppense TaxID=170557 RepID=A0A7R9CMF3_TIMPO|nr:unnamed protein product [Timema poppensis]